MQNHGAFLRGALLAGAAGAISLFASASLAAAAPSSHSMTIRLPDGELAQIHYWGNLPPRVSFDTAPVAVADPLAAMARLDRLSMEMNREMNREMAMAMREADALTSPWPVGPTFSIAFPNVPPSGVLPNVVAAAHAGHGHFCMHTMQVTRGPHGHRKVVRHTYGSCGSNGHARFDTGRPFTPHHRYHTIEVSTHPRLKAEPQSSLVEAAYRPH